MVDLFIGCALVWTGAMLLLWALLRTPQENTPEDPWWTEYRAFLASPEWQSIRYKKLSQVRFRCEGKHFFPEHRHLQVHHLTYWRYREGRLEDLQVLCRKHHQLVHNRKF